MKQSLGLVEVKGLALAITVADHMVKSSNVNLMGLERARGFGWTLIKVSGDVGSVEAAVDCGAEFARRNNGLVASKTIARPGGDLVSVLESREYKKAAKVVGEIVDNIVESTAPKKASVSKDISTQTTAQEAKTSEKPTVTAAKAKTSTAVDYSGKSGSQTTKTSGTPARRKVMKQQAAQKAKA